jgi:hypothetical protein
LLRQCLHLVRATVKPSSLEQFWSKDALPTTLGLTEKRLVDQPLTQPAPPKPKWWKRNWKWFVPLGCFTVALLFLVFVSSVLVIVFSAIKSTDVYKEALARAKADPAVIEALGSPIKDGFLVSGNTNVNGPAGESNLAIPSPGPRQKGQFTCRQTSHSGSGIIRGSSWKSDKRINVSMSFKNRRGPIRATNPRLSSAETTIKLRSNLDCQDQ